MSSDPWYAASLSPPLDYEHDDGVDFGIIVITNTLITNHHDAHLVGGRRGGG